MPTYCPYCTDFTESSSKGQCAECGKDTHTASAPFNEQLSRFATEVLEITKECIREGHFECSAEVLANIAVDAGIIQYVDYDPNNHRGVSNVEPGEKIYYWVEPGEKIYY